MKVLVTGSEGFIGRNLVNKLFAEDNDILEFDAKHFEPMKLFDVVDFSKINYIYHLGAISSTVEQDVDKLYEHNVKFSIELFKNAIEYQIPVIYASSASIYGNTMKDGLYLHNPLNYYATTKMIVDLWVYDNIQRFSHVVGLRLFNVYGADEKKNDLSTSPIYRFGLQAKNEGVIKIFKGSHNTYRDFICVEDVLSAFDYYTKKSTRGIYDVGTGKPISFMDVAELCSQKYNVPIKIIPEPDFVRNGKYQFYTKARPNMPFFFKSVEEWLRLN